MAENNFKQGKLHAALPLVLAVVVLIVTMVTFSEVLKADFVMWDDDLDILGNKKLTNSSLWWVFTDVDSMQRYNPFTFLAWSLTYHLTGFDPFWFHFGNWLLHGLSAVLLYLVLRDLLIIAAHKNPLAGHNACSREFAAVAGALLWALHPLRVESVVWAAARSYCQAIFFILGTLLCYLRAQQAVNLQQFRLYMALSLVCYISSLLSYPVGITLFAVFFLLDIFLLRPKVFSFAVSKGAKAKVKQVLRGKLIFVLSAFAFAVVAVVVRHRAMGIWGAPVPLSQFGLLDRVMQSFYVWSYYLWKPFYPVKLAPIYTTLLAFDPLSLPFLLGVFLVAGISALCLFLRKRWPFLLGVWICYLVLQVPFLGIFEHPHFTVDRYSLLSSLCFSVLASVVLVRLVSMLRPLPVFCGMSVVLVVLAWLSFKQVAVWRNSETLFTHTIQTLGDDPYRAQIMGRLATYYYQIGQTERSIDTLKKLLVIKPKSYKANSQLASIYCAKGQFAAALPHYEKMLAQEPDNPQAHYDYGVALKKLGRQVEAGQQFHMVELLRQ
ncbi:tetratricopeptide repeat protein [Geotalea sp. SG265]|uniref:tetratricopeptide repeat protein n=1 Tax=Geotalea sp. SG265 TaxID=2922867 RepID=UPI001FAE90B7|nr:tetratricopeptide repeat protein [Geotalea sp. SG265]